MLDLDMTREASTPRDAATLVVVRNAPGGLEVFCVERQKAGFLAGAVVFPGGKLEADDLAPDWSDLATSPRLAGVSSPADEAKLRGLAVAACREALEEAAILPVVGPALPHPELLEWRERLARKETTLRALLVAATRRLDLGSLHPLARWVTPAAEARRFDTCFFLHVVDMAVAGAHDDVETTASFWARPVEVLRRFDAGELLLVPPTHRTLEVLATARDAHEAIALADAACLDPICPKLVAYADSMALVLPGDPEHEVQAQRSPGKSRYVLRDGRFVPGDPP